MRILLIEDDTELGPATLTRLRENGLAADLAATLLEADDKLSTNRYDCIVSDRRLPDGDGLAYLIRMRRNGSTTPVLILSVLGSARDRVEGLDHGADDYLQKPFLAAELIARVRALCRRTDHPRPSIMRCGEIVIDVARRRVFRGSDLMTLRAKDFAVLELLVSRAGHVVRRSELIECCWDEMAEPMSNVVDVAVGRLRRALGPPALITTVRGVGFMIRESEQRRMPGDV